MKVKPKYKKGDRGICSDETGEDFLFTIKSVKPRLMLYIYDTFLLTGELYDVDVDWDIADIDATSRHLTKLERALR